MRYSITIHPTDSPGSPGIYSGPIDISPNIPYFFNIPKAGVYHAYVTPLDTSESTDTPSTVTLEHLPASFTGKKVRVQNENLDMTGQLSSISTQYSWNNDRVERTVSLYLIGYELVEFKRLPPTTTFTLLKDQDD